jgi:spore coat protein U-like protein
MIESLKKQLPSGAKRGNEQLLSLLSNFIIIKEVTIMKRILMVVLFCIMLAVMVVSIPDMAAAATAQAALTVSATVVSSCNVTGTTAVAFGNYDPTAAADNIAGAGSMTFRCTKGTSYKLWINGTRTMAGPVDSLPYLLFTDVPRTVTFPASAAAATAVASTGNAPVTTNIYGRIVALQNVGAGAYTNTLQASVDY